MSINFNPITQALDGNGNPLAGAKYNFYEAGTSTRKDTFTTQAGDVAHANPVIADGNGNFAAIWLSGNYKEDLTDASDVSLAGFPVDNVSSSDADTLYGRSVLSSAGSAANVITADLPVAPSTLEDQQQITVELQNGANTSNTPTFELNDLGAKTCVRGADAPLLSGDTGGIGYKCQFNYSLALDSWVLMNPYEALGFGLPFYSGLELSNDSDASHDVEIAAGKILDSTQAQILTLSSALTKRIDGNWSAGDNAGGFPSGLTLANNTWYRIFLIMDPSTGLVDAGYDTSATAANLIADATAYTLYRRVGWVLTDSSSNILPWSSNIGRRYVWNVADNSAQFITAITERTLVVDGPVGQICQIRASLFAVGGSGPTVSQYVVIREDDQTDSAASASNHTIALDGDSANDVWNTVIIDINMNDSGLVRFRASQASVMWLYSASISWTDNLEVA